LGGLFLFCGVFICALLDENLHEDYFGQDSAQNVARMTAKSNESSKYAPNLEETQSHLRTPGNLLSICHTPISRDN
jgi:hypothetical protein